MKLDFTLHGKWLIRYDPAAFSYHAILSQLLALQNQLQQQKLNYKFINVNFSRNIPRNRFFSFGDHLAIGHNGSDKRLAETDPGGFAVQTALEPLNKPIRSINLLFPRLESDQRWKTMGLPTAQLFLASGLQANGFQTATMPLVLPTANPPAGALLADMAGFTIFEDLLPSLRPFLASFRAIFAGIIAAGGPFPTLAPLAAIKHLPQIDLFVRGEAEQVLPVILDAMNRGDAETLFKQKGLFWQQPGLIVMSEFERVNRPEKFRRFQVNFDFLRPEHLEHGLEINFSRGCGRSCVFCCRAQGNTFRKLPLDKAEELLKEYRNKIERVIESSKSPRPLAGPPPLVRGVDETKSVLFEIEGLIDQTPTKGQIDGRGDPLDRPIDQKALRASQRGAPTIGDSTNIPPLSRGDKGGIEIPGSGSGRVANPPLRASGPSSTERLNSHIDSKSAYTVNINDDDILQDPAYAAAIFALLKKYGFRIIGIQTAPAALVQSNEQVNYGVLDIAADPELYVDSRPLLWLGTDVFLPQRARRLGKRLPSMEVFAGLLAELEKHGLRHFHYWISSDNDSTWEEFIEELGLIINYYHNYPNFGLLAHAPFIVPYPASRLFQRLTDDAPNLKIKLSLDAADPRFSYRVVERLETKHVNLNKLLNNEKAGGEFGFFDLLKSKDFIAAAQLAYHFLKQEALQSSEMEPILISARNNLENVIGRLLENRT
jgi:hypothetical protein